MAIIEHIVRARENSARALVQASIAISSAFNLTRRTLKYTALAHYNIVGKHTFPLQKNPHHLSDVNPLAQIVAFPAVISAWLAALVIFPIIGHSFKKALTLGRLGLNFSLEDKHFNASTLETSTVNAKLQNIYGAIGYGIGFLPTLLTIFAIGAYRGAKQSLHHFRMAFASITNVTTLDVYLEKRLFPDTIQMRARFLAISRANKAFALPGLMLAGLSGILAIPFILVGRSIKHSAIAAKRLCQGSTNFALEEHEAPEKPSYFADSQSKLIAAMRLPGYLLSAPIAALTIFTLGIYRSVKHSVQHFPMSFAAIANVTTADLDDENKLFPDANVKREIFRGSALANKAFSTPGVILGGICGLFATPCIFSGRSFKHSIIAAKRFCQGAANFTLEEHEAPTKPDYFADSKSKLIKVMRIPGYVLSAPLAGLTIFALGLYRTIKHSLQHFPMSFASVTNSTTADLDPELKLFPDAKVMREGYQQSPGSNKAFAIPGVILGGICGVVATPFIFVARNFKHAAIAAKRLCQGAANFALEEHEAPAKPSYLTDSKSKLIKAMRLPGYVLAAPAAGLTVFALGLYRSIKHSVQHFPMSFAKITNVVTADLDEAGKLFPNAQARREGYQQAARANKIFALPGVAIGGICGVVATPFIFAARSVKHTIIAAKRLCQGAAQFALEEHEAPVKPIYFADSKSKLITAMRLPGYVLAAPAAGLTVFALGLYRSIKHSVQHFPMSFAAITNVATVDLDAERRLFPNAQAMRQDYQQAAYANKIFALPGVAIGGICGVVATPFIFAARSVKHAAIAAKRLCQGAANFALEQHEAPEKPSYFADSQSKLISVMRLPGYVLSAPIAVLTVFVLGIYRTSKHSLQHLPMSFATITNVATADLKAAQQLFPNAKAMREGYQQAAGSNKIFALPGLILGGVLGVFSTPFIAIARCVGHAALSFKYLSGGALNAATDRLMLANLGEDKRPGYQKIMGLGGYVAASFLTCPAALLIKAVRYSPLLLGLLGTPFVGLHKMYRFVRPRFNKNKSGDAGVIRDVNGKIDYSGKVPARAKITRSSGRKGLLRGLFKSLVFNASTPSEDLILELEKVRKNSHSQNFIGSSQYVNAVAKVKERYAEGAVSCCGMAPNTTDDEAEINRLDKIIRGVKGIREFEDDFEYVTPALDESVNHVVNLHTAMWQRKYQPILLPPPVPPKTSYGTSANDEPRPFLPKHF